MQGGDPFRMLTAVRSYPFKSAEMTGELTRIAATAPETWSREEFARAVRPLFPPLLRLCRTLADTPEAAEDLLQNALIKAYLHRSSFRGESPLLGWLYGIIRNEHIDSVRSTARRRVLMREALERFGALFEDWFGASEGASRGPDPERNLVNAQDSEGLLSALRALPEPYRTVVWLCDIEEQPYQTVSETLSLPLGTVKSRHARGRARLRALLEEPKEGAK